MNGHFWDIEIHNKMKRPWYRMLLGRHGLFFDAVFGIDSWFYNVYSTID